MLGKKNHIHKMSDEARKEMGRKNSIHMKKRIKDGTFTPAIINSWAHSRKIVKIFRNNKKVCVKVRSSWEAYFQIYYLTLLYEKIRIPYVINNKFHSYIVDFVDLKNKKLYEVKPNGFKITERNIIKEKAVKKWANDNGYSFVYIDNEWVLNNYDSKKIKDQPERDELRRLLKQFDKNEN